MDRQAAGSNCAIYCWSVGVVSGVLAFVVLWGLVGIGAFLALLLGVLVAVGAGYFLIWAFCMPLGAASQGIAAAAGPAAVQAPAAQPVTTGPATASAATMAPPSPDPDIVAPVPEPAAPAVPDPAPEPDTAPEATPAPAAPAAVGLLSEPKGQADDLKRIKGVGPALEGRLNDLGVFHYAQIAAWGPDEVAWVDGHLKFRGRIERDDWIAQARTLAEGGETEFSRRADGR